MDSGIYSHQYLCPKTHNTENSFTGGSRGDSAGLLEPPFRQAIFNFHGDFGHKVGIPGIILFLTTKIVFYKPDLFKPDLLPRFLIKNVRVSLN
jgi:hypothetical protein